MSAAAAERKTSLSIRTSWGLRCPTAWDANPIAEHLHKNSRATSQKQFLQYRNLRSIAAGVRTHGSEVTILSSPAKPHTCLPPLSPPKELPVNTEGRTVTQLSTGCAQEQVSPGVGSSGFAIPFSLSAVLRGQDRWEGLACSSEGQSACSKRWQRGFGTSFCTVRHRRNTQGQSSAEA